MSDTASVTACAVHSTLPAGVGFAEALFDLHEELLSHGLDLVARCGCAAGCPACVGPPGDDPDDNGRDARDFARAILGELRASDREAGR